MFIFLMYHNIKFLSVTSHPKILPSYTLQTLFSVGLTVVLSYDKTINELFCKGRWEGGEEGGGRRREVCSFIFGAFSMRAQQQQQKTV